MGRNKIAYTETDLMRKTYYTVVISEKKDTQAYKTTLELASQYVNQYKNRKAVLFVDENIISVNENIADVKEIYPGNIQTVKNKVLKIKQLSGGDITKEDHMAIAFPNMKSGLFAIIDDVTPPMLKFIYKTINKGVDILVHRETPTLLPEELDYIKKDNKTLVFRVHNTGNKDILQQALSLLPVLIQQIGDMPAIGILVAQQYANYKHNYILDNKKELQIKEQDIEKHASQSCYFDCGRNKLIIPDAEKELFEKCITEFCGMLEQTGYGGFDEIIKQLY